MSIFDSPPPTIPGYALHETLGDGGTGRVYHAEHEDTGLEVAIKVLDEGLARDQAAAKRFVREAKLLSGINHPNVVTLYELGYLPDGRPYQVMEYLRGEDLSRLMARRDRFAAEELVPYVQQICLGLHVAHERGVVHRDLKPENIVLLSTTPLQIKLIDFGAAKPMGGDSLTRENLIVGTPHFVAPEQLRGAPIDRRVDIYALGVLLYWMLAGHAPFRQESARGMLQAHLRERPTNLSMICPELLPDIAWLVHRCLEKRPDERPPTASIVAGFYLQALTSAGRGQSFKRGEIAEAWSGAELATVQHRLSDEPARSVSEVSVEELEGPTTIRRLADTEVVPSSEAVELDTKVRKK